MPNSVAHQALDIHAALPGPHHDDSKSYVDPSQTHAVSHGQGHSDDLKDQCND